MAGHSLFTEFVREPATPEDYEQILALHAFQPTDENQFFYTREGSIGPRRFIFSFDVSRFFGDIDSRNKRIAKAMAWIAEKNASLSAAKKSRRKETVERDVKQMLAKRKLKSLLQVTVTPIEVEVAKKDGTTRRVQSFQLAAEIDKMKEIEIRKSDGMTCFITNEATFSPAQVIQKYREKNKIEEAFREMKSQLALRPIHLTRPERVKAHVTVCILAYLLSNTLEIRLRRSKYSSTTQEVLKLVQSCQLNQVGFKGSTYSSITMTEMTEPQKQIMALLQCESYVKPKKMKQLIQSLGKTL